MKTVTCRDASGLPSMLTKGKRYKVISGPTLDPAVMRRFVRVLSDSGDPYGDSVYAHRFEEYGEEWCDG